jgi:hypothetical protein
MQQLGIFEIAKNEIKNLVEWLQSQLYMRNSN